jgi:lipoate-protein ligase A
MTRWELILDGAADGAENMAKDAALLERVEQTAEPRTIVRFYQWSRPTISLGKNQKVDAAVDSGYCRLNGIDVVFRPTGGRAVLHDDEITYAVVSNDTSRFGDTIYGNYKRVSEALCKGYRALGVPATLASDTAKYSAEPGVDAPCFVSPCRYELMAGGRKIVGSAQRRIRRSFLQHGSMPITCNRRVLALATRMPDPAILEREMAGMAEFIPRPPSIPALQDAFLRAFREYFSVEFML